VLAPAVAAISLCRPAQGLGTLTYRRAGVAHVVDLATCHDRPFGSPPPVTVDPSLSPNGRFRASVHRDTVVATNLRDHRSVDLFRGPKAIELVGWTPDSRWILFAIDPMGSASIAADGLTLRAVAAGGRGAATVASGLLYDDYRAWCGGRLVLTAGGDRIATTNKRLLVTSPGIWRARPLVRAPTRAWGSVACAPGGRSVVVQSQAATGLDMSVDHSHWSLWRVGLDGSQTRLTTPPPGFSDDSPLPSGDTVFFVRSRLGVGSVYALRNGKVYGPFATLARNPGYYGHRAWRYAVTR
jgi:hypothetical protein